MPENVSFATGLTTYTAIFRRMDHAKAFLARLGEGRDLTEPGAFRNGRKVTFVAMDGWEAWSDYAELVGYFGSAPTGPVATLNGLPTPRSY